MPAIADYTALVAAIGDWLDRNDLSGNAPTMIALCEARLKREVIPLFAEATVSVTATGGLANLPADFGTLTRVVWNNGASTRKTLKQIGLAQGTDIPDDNAPAAYTLEANKLRLWPAGDFLVDILYYQTLTPLSATNTSNTLLKNHPDLYLFGALMYAEGFVANDERAGMFKAMWDEALAEVRVFLTRQRFAGPLVPRMSFVP